MRACKILFLLAISLLFFSFCSDNGNGKKDDDDTAIFINKSSTNVVGIDSIYIGPGESAELKATTFEPELTPEYQWTSANESIVTIIPTEDNSVVMAKAVGDSGETTIITVEDIANGGSKILDVKVLKWPDMTKFIHIGQMDGHNYFISNHQSTWGSAMVECEENGGHLLTIQSQEENDFVNATNSEMRESIWIGLRYNDSLTYTAFANEWITGEPLEFKNWWRPDEGTKYPQEIQNYYPYYFALMNRWGFWENQATEPKYFVLELE